MADENIVPLQSVNDSGQALSISHNGTPTRIDIVTGHLFDAKGNPAGRWAPMDKSKTGDENKALRMTAHQLSAATSAASLAGSCISQNPDYIRNVAGQFLALSNATESQRLQIISGGQALDVGVNDVHVAGALTNFVTGYANDGPVADVFSPPLVVQHKSDYFWQFQKEDAFQRALPQLGATAGTPLEVQPRFGNTKFIATLRALGAFVPTEVEANQDAPLNIKMAHLNRLVDASILERELRVQSMARTSGNWNAATTLVAGFQWNGGASSDPVKDFNNACETSYGKPNGTIIPEHIWNAMCRNPAVRSYYAYGGTAPGILTDTQMAALLKLPEIYISRMKYITSTGTLAYVWGNDVVIFRRPAAIPPVNQRDACTSVTFRWGMQNVKLQDSQTFTPDMIDGRGWVLRQFYNQVRGELGGIQMVLVLADAEKMTSAYIGNLLINAYQ